MPIKNNQINLFILLVAFGTNFIFTKENKQFLYHYSFPQIFQELTMCKFSKRGEKKSLTIQFISHSSFPFSCEDYPFTHIFT